MTAAAWIAVVLLVVCVVLIYLLVGQMDRAEKAERHIRWLSEQADELRADYGAEISRSKRMALRAVERDS